MGKTLRVNLKWHGVLFFIWPLLSFVLVAIGQIKSRASLYIIVGFYALFGLTFKVYSDSIDSSRHSKQFQEVVDLSFEGFLKKAGGLYYSMELKPDLLQNVLNFVVSRFTKDPQYLFFGMALLLGVMLYFLIGSLNEVYAKGNKDRFGLMFILFIIILFLPFRILSFRHYFAALYFLYFAYKYFSRQKDLKYLIFASFAVFSHFGFFLAVGLLWLYHFVGNKNMLYYVLIIISFGVQSQTIELIRGNRDIVPPGLEINIRGYTSEKYLTKVSKSKNNSSFFLGNYNSWMNTFFVLSLIAFKMRNRINQPVLENFFSFLMLLYAFLGFTSDLASVSGRFGVVFSALCCIFFTQLFSSVKIKKWYLFKILAIVFFIINVVVLGRLTMGSMNVSAALPFLPLCLFSEIDGTFWELFGF